MAGVKKHASHFFEHHLQQTALRILQRPFNKEENKQTNKQTKQSKAKQNKLNIANPTPTAPPCPDVAVTSAPRVARQSSCHCRVNLCNPKTSTRSSEFVPSRTVLLPTKVHFIFFQGSVGVFYHLSIIQVLFPLKRSLEDFFSWFVFGLKTTDPSTEASCFVATQSKLRSARPMATCEENVLTIQGQVGLQAKGSRAKKCHQRTETL